MKLHELLERATDEDLSFEIGTIEDYILHYTARPEALKHAVETLIQVPEYRYEGDMYRALAVEVEEVLNTPDVRQLLSKLQSYGQQEKQPYQSWVPELSLLPEVLHNNINAEIYSNFNYPTFFVLQQKGAAVDTHNLPIDIPPVYEGEKELLAPIYNNIHLVGFFEFTHFFPVSKFKEYIAKLKDELKQIQYS